MKVNTYNRNNLISFYAGNGFMTPREKRQAEEAADEQSVDELCKNRPADEYFRLTTEGDCRDVVR